MTDTNNTVGPILKTDTRGRVRTSAQRRESLLAEFDRSGLSGKQFSELSGIKYQTFATWLQKRRRAGQPSVKPTDPVRWLEAVVERAPTSGGQSALALVIKLPGAASLEVSDLKQVPLAVALLRSLEPAGGPPLAC
jgi:hypothetical protein